MSYETIQNKKFLDSDGVGHLWEKIRDRYDSKLDSVTNTDSSIRITGNNSIAVKISEESGNVLQLKTTGNTGLYVASTVVSSERYSIVKDDDSGIYSAVYHLKHYSNDQSQGENVGVAINIPKDMVIQSGLVVEKSTEGEWGPAGTYIELTLANANSQKIYIPVSNLIEYVTSGSQNGDMVFITIDPATHRVTASITDGTITKAKLTSELQTSLGKADTAIQNIAESEINGSIMVDGSNVPVHGLGTAAYTNATAYDASGAAAAVLGTDQDTSATMTVYGVKQYASDVYGAIRALTNTEIDSAIAEVNAQIGS